MAENAANAGEFPQRDIFPKDVWTSDQVDAEREMRLAAGASRCTRSEDAANYFLETVWPEL